MPAVNFSSEMGSLLAVGAHARLESAYVYITDRWIYTFPSLLLSTPLLPTLPVLHWITLYRTRNSSLMSSLTMSNG